MGPGRVHRRLVNEVPEDMEVGRRFHVPARSSRLAASAL